ncbi:fucose 4-O-acetylase [Vibrio ishigakensis]|uniref:Fucose 4-O-acetylase n=1 Tax=Vibrio ishigakensis TaxID=1481914 RepID=A0A0B8P5F3_9VIBR|nr:fucose 4-O-acetylase [Vibrio ishigakensis]
MSTNKIASFELGRVIAIFAVITIHCQLFVTYPLLGGEAWFGHIINQLCRFAVPFFFLLTGFLIQPKLKTDPINTAINYCKPILLIWMVWSLIYLAAPFNLATLMSDGYLAERDKYWGFLMQTPLNSFLEGGLVHLWYLMSLIIGILIIAIMQKLGLEKALIPLSIVLFLYGVLAGSYAVLTDLEAPFLTRNGPFLSLIMICLGGWIRENNIKISAKAAFIMMAVGALFHLAEAYLLSGHGMDFRLNDFLFATPIWHWVSSSIY